MRRRKLTYVIALVVAVGAVAAGAALGANTVRCGGLYQPRCAPPTITNGGLTPACHNAGAVFTLPKLSFSAVAGIKSIEITVHSKPVTVLHVKGNGVRTKTISGVKIHTAGLASGVHTVTVTLTDNRGVKTTSTLRFVICTPVPRTTG
jgi:hypothetical protein